MKMNLKPYKKKILALSIIILIVLSSFSIIFVYFNTGFFAQQINTSTKMKDDEKVWLTETLGKGPKKVDLKYGKNREMLDSKQYVTSWHRKEMSEKILVDSKAVFMNLPMSTQTVPPHFFGMAFGRCHYRVLVRRENTNYWTTVYDEKGVRKNPNGMPWIDIIDGGQYQQWENSKPISPTKIYFGHKNLDWWIAGNLPINSDIVHHKAYNPGFSFRFYGPFSGAVKIKAVNEYFGWTSEGGIGGGTKKFRENIVVASDQATLFSGYGDISLIPNQNNPSQPDKFEEGQTMKLELSTGYAGPTVDNGWRLKCFNPKGEATSLPGGLKDDDGNTISFDSKYRGYVFENHLNQKNVHWNIPVGTYNPNGKNRWYFKLYNTLTEQDSEKIDVWIEGASEIVPTWGGIKFDQDKYFRNEPITITMWAFANPDGTGTINEFECLVYHDHPSNQRYHAYKKAQHVKGNKYQAVFTFTPKRSEEINIEGTAWDKPHDQGGLAVSGEKGLGIYEPGEQEKYSLTINVTKFGTRVQGAKVTVGGTSKFTDYNGQAFFFYMKNGTFDVKVEHPTRGSVTQSVTVKGDTYADIELGLNFTVIAICAMIFIIFTIFALTIDSYIKIDDKIQLLIVVLGIIVTLIIYIYLTGGLGIF